MNNSQQPNGGEFKEKMAIKTRLGIYYRNQAKKNGLESLKRVKAYLPEKYQGMLMQRDIVFSHLDIEPIVSLIAEGKEFTVVSGLNPSSPLHLGHKALFENLVFLQQLGGRIYVPITNDESYIDGKVGSLGKSRELAYKEIIPNILAFGFVKGKTHIFVDSDYPDLYNIAMLISKHVSYEQLASIFGKGSLENTGQIFYRSCVQIAQILLPQLPEFGGPKHTLIPVGIDQHPYILLARDVAKKMKLIPPSELVMKFMPSLKNPEEKMSGSKPETAIYLTDTPEIIQKKIQKTYTGGSSSLVEYQKCGGIPEICSVYALLQYLCKDSAFLENVYKRYKKGTITMDELKKVATKIVITQVADHQEKKLLRREETTKFLLKASLYSFLKYEEQIE